MALGQLLRWLMVPDPMVGPTIPGSMQRLV